MKNTRGLSLNGHRQKTPEDQDIYGYLSCPWVRTQAGTKIKGPSNGIHLYVHTEGVRFRRTHAGGVGSGVHSPKSMIHITYSPISTKLINSPYFWKINTFHLFPQN